MYDKNKINTLRKQLNKIPETAWNEKRTHRLLKDFLAENTDFEIIDMGSWFYARRIEGKDLKTICFRADTDALPDGLGGACHRCGHDGHSAALCGLGLALKGIKLGKNICLLFQPAEETGEGARVCLEIFKREKIDGIYGFHNIPGFEEGAVLMKKGVFALCSLGMTIHLKGKACHAAYPETGKNPAYIIAELTEHIREIKREDILISIINIRLGDKNFGISPGYGELSLTIRALSEEALCDVVNGLKAIISKKASAEGIAYGTEIFDRFPATINRGDVYDEVFSLIKNDFRINTLKEPMRWSEDFGQYLKVCRGMFFGIGSGKTAPPLHTEGYTYNDNITHEAVRLFLRLAEGVT